MNEMLSSFCSRSTPSLLVFLAHRHQKSLSETKYVIIIGILAFPISSSPLIPALHTAPFFR
jgi:AmiR/NasT family two-component response regulator